MQCPTDYEQRIAVAWAAAWLAKFDAANPNASVLERKKEFLEALEGGISIAHELTSG